METPNSIGPHRQRLLHNGALFLIWLTLFSGCAPATPEVSGPTPTALMSAAAAPLPEKPNMALYIVECLMADFATYFTTEKSPGTFVPVEQPAIFVRWDDLKSKVPTSTDPDVHTGIRVLYGLEAAESGHRFTYALEVTTLKRTVDPLIWEVDDSGKTKYKVNGDGTLAAITGPWAPQDLYFERVQVQRTSAKADRYHVVRTFDTENYIFPWEGRLLELYEDNDKPEFLRFVCLAEPFFRVPADEVDMRHHLAAIAAKDDGGGGLEDLLNNDPATDATDYLNKAADIGSPCPPRCGNKIILPESGMMVRADCK